MYALTRQKWTPRTSRRHIYALRQSRRTLADAPNYKAYTLCSGENKLSDYYKIATRFVVKTPNFYKLFIKKDVPNVYKPYTRIAAVTNRPSKFPQLSSVI